MDTTKKPNEPATYLYPNQTVLKMLLPNRIITFSITESMAKIKDYIVILLRTKKLSPYKTSKVLHADKILSERILEKILWAVSIKAIGWVFRTGTNNNHPKVTESEKIGANHLGFAKFLFQQYSQQLELNNNHFPAESAFNFYINNKITDCLGGTVNIKSTRKNFYTELFQHTSLPKNYSFVPIIKKINQTIEKYTQQQFPIPYADKDKEKLQTPAITPKQIQPHTWKKTRVELPTNTLYYYTPRSASTFYQQTHPHYT
ncbi:hypothetical protein G9A89_016173 [Geosiphon pyriformis]|nr:hypothetical protein G9A89_016173 [Geosiphon pyriformis]